MPRQRWDNVKSKLKQCENEVVNNVKKPLYQCFVTLYQCRFNIGLCIKVAWHWRSYLRFCLIVNVRSTLFQCWPTTLKQNRSDLKCWLGHLDKNKKKWMYGSLKSLNVLFKKIIQFRKQNARLFVEKLAYTLLFCKIVKVFYLF